MNLKTKCRFDVKTCKRCLKEKHLSDFYVHKAMKDGHLNFCKECKKTESIENRNRNIERHREYDRKRGNRQDYSYFVLRRKENPNQYKATTAVSNAVRDGKLTKQPCEICGSKERIHAHHDDYLKPLDVRWLCAAHHKQWHRDNGEAKNLR